MGCDESVPHVAEPIRTLDRHAFRARTSAMSRNPLARRYHRQHHIGAARLRRCRPRHAPLGRARVIPALRRTPDHGRCARCDMCIDQGARRAAPSAPLDVDNRERRTRDPDRDTHSQRYSARSTHRRCTPAARLSRHAQRCISRVRSSEHVDSMF